jgi:hypothetical protein
VSGTGLRKPLRLETASEDDPTLPMDRTNTDLSVLQRLGKILRNSLRSEPSGIGSAKARTICSSSEEKLVAVIIVVLSIHRWTEKSATGRKRSTEGVSQFEFLRNDGTSFRLQGLESKAECFSPAMQILDYSRAVSCLVIRGARVNVFHPMTHGVVK